jgi:DUF4097 and DUF4098 domain-containing protein YvlB
MKKAAVLIGILTLVIGAIATNQTRATRAYVATIEPSFVNTTQKPKGDELTENFQQSYPLSPTGRVSISNINGDVHIKVWDQSSVRVDAVKRAYSAQRLAEVTIEVTNKGDGLQIRTKYPDQQNYGRGKDESPASVEYTLTLPRIASLEGADLVNGSLDIEGLQGDVRASLVNGTVAASGLAGEVKLSTVNGAIVADLSTLGSAKNVNLNSVNGSIVLVVPAGASADVKASTIHGAINNDFGLTVEEGQYVGRNLSGQIGSGGMRVRLNNVNGPITIKRGGGTM